MTNHLENMHGFKVLAGIIYFLLAQFFPLLLALFFQEISFPFQHKATVEHSGWITSLNRIL